MPRPAHRDVVHRMRMALVALMIASTSVVPAQTPQRTPSALPTRSVAVVGGMSWPVSHDGIMQYWRGGPSAGTEIAFRVGRRTWIGIEVEASALWFRAGKFGGAHPGVRAEHKHIAHMAIGLTGKYEFAAVRRLIPYVGLSVGASRLTPAIAQEIVDSVRVTYFNIPGRTRLSVGFLGGVSYPLTRWLAIGVEARWLYVHNDPDIGATTAVRGRLQFSV
ncbi:MAG: opacity family porin [Bacteroidota bacterium]